MKITPYLMFNGNAEEAAGFYADLLGGKIENLFRYSDMPPMPGLEVPDGYGRKIGHCCVMFQGGAISMADTVPSDPRGFGNGGHILAFVCDSAEQAEAAYRKLCDGATKINCELGKVFYARLYGEVVDKYGVLWSVMFE